MKEHQETQGNKDQSQKMQHTRPAAQATTLPDFNPTHDSRVSEIKSKTEALLVLCRELQQQGNDGRLLSLAITSYETAAMYAVKSLFVGKQSI